jgi:hypothetical protein
MDKLPKKHVLTAEEKKVYDSLPAREKALVDLAFEKLETSFRLEWSHMWKEVGKAKK